MTDSAYFKYVLENKKIRFHNNSYADEFKVGQLSMFKAKQGFDLLVFRFTLSRTPEVTITKSVEEDSINMSRTHKEEVMFGSLYDCFLTHKTPLQW